MQVITWKEFKDFVDRKIAEQHGKEDIRISFIDWAPDLMEEPQVYVNIRMRPVELEIHS